MRTITRHNIVVIAIAVIIAIAIPFIYIYKAGTQSNINYKVFRATTGWGYDIVMNGKLIIHQEYIPTINRKKEFLTATQAKETALLVISKLKNNKFPTLSKKEVEQICGTDN
jgi:hypothetical protein